MHSDVRERRGRDPVGIHAAADRDAQCDAVVGEQLIHLAGVPAGVAKLDDPAAKAREQCQEIAESGQLDRLRGRKLEQDGAELGTETVGPLEKQSQLKTDLAESLDMGDEAAGLRRELESRRSAPSGRTWRVPFRQCRYT